MYAKLQYNVIQFSNGLQLTNFKLSEQHSAPAANALPKVGEAVSR